MALEQMELEPALRPLTSPARWGVYRYLATLYICRTGVAAPVWSKLEDELTALAQNEPCPQATRWGVSALAAHGLVVRGLGINGRQLSAGLTKLWAAAKQALYGRAAHAPRKLY